MTQTEDDFGVDDTGVSCRDVTDHLPTAIASLSLNKAHKHTKSASTSSIQRRRIPQADMPKLTNLDQLTSHSPSSQIVGTPFATDSKKFEYPFPEDVSSSSYSASASSSSYATPAGAILTPPLSSGMFPLISASTSPAQLTLPCLIQPGDSSSSSSSTTSSTSSFTPIVHPKLKPPINPPIPPSLVKKRPRWSLGIMGRRRSGYDGFSDGDGSLNLIEGFLTSEFEDGVMVPHSQRDELSRTEH